MGRTIVCFHSLGNLLQTYEQLNVAENRKHINRKLICIQISWECYGKQRKYALLVKYNDSLVKDDEFIRGNYLYYLKNRIC